MPVAVTEAPYQSLPIEAPRKRWSRAECEALEAIGLWEQQKLELVGGELISKMGKNRRHTNALSSMLAWLIKTFGEKFVNPEAPIDVAPEDNPTNEPQPDIIVLKRSTWEFESNPVPADLNLVVEIADTTLGFDLKTKATLYARAGILEYWVLDVSARRLLVHREPVAGRYVDVVIYSDQESVSPLAVPHAQFHVADAFR